MATNITGGNNMVGTSNRQFIINSNNNFTINMNFHVNCTECHQHRHKEGFFHLGEEIDGVIDSLQKIALSGRYTTPVTAVSATQQQTEAAIKSHIDPAPQRTADGTDSVRILDIRDQVLKPGDAVWADHFSIYVGDGSVVRSNKSSNTVVKEKLDITRRYRKGVALSEGKLNEFPPEERVQRALQQVGRPCPIPGGDSDDFVFWIFTGLRFKQSSERGFYFSPWSVSDPGWLLKFIILYMARAKGSRS